MPPVGFEPTRPLRAIGFSYPLRLSPPGRVAQLRALYEGDEAWVLMALEGDEVVGVVSLSPGTAADPEPAPRGTIYLWQMFVAAAWQGRGLAQALLDLLLDEARRRGYERMTLWAAAGAQQARRFYEKEGFTPTGRTQPQVAVAEPAKNGDQVLDLVGQGDEAGIALMVFPELCLSAYSIDDLLFQDAVLDAVAGQVDRLVAASRKLNPVFVVGG